MNRLQEGTLVVVGGAIGGVISVLDAWADPVSFPLTLSKLASLVVIPAIKGGAAAGIGVFLLTTLDSAQLLRSFFFSVACGLTFPTILTSGTGYAQKVTSQVATKAIADNTTKLKGAVASVSTAASAAAVSASAVVDIHDASLAILQAASRVPLIEAQAANAVVQEAVSRLAKAAAATNDAKSSEAVSQIRAAAVALNLPTGTTAWRIPLEQYHWALGGPPEATNRWAKPPTPSESPASATK